MGNLITHISSRKKKAQTSGIEDKANIPWSRKSKTLTKVLDEGIQDQMKGHKAESVLYKEQLFWCHKSFEHVHIGLYSHPRGE